jgi:hypothetical protein
MTTTAATPQVPPDLRRRDNTRVIARTETALAVSLDHGSAITKRRSIGLPSSRGTWVRIEARPYARVLNERQSWNGTEAAALLEGISKPEWLASTSWSDPEHGLMWRADETSHIAAPPVRSAGPITQAPDLDRAWWATLVSSLAALANHATTRIATPDTLPITQQRISETISAVYPDRIDTRVTTWTTAHADLNWANLTGAPTCVILDWEDWGTAPRGLDSANLWFNSLSVPELANQVAVRLRADLESVEGRVCSLFLCCQHLHHDPVGEDRLTGAVRKAADNLVSAIGPQ